MKQNKKQPVIQRYPRPQSFTNMCIAYHTNKTIPLSTLRNVAIQLYLSQSFLIPTKVSHPVLNTKKKSNKYHNYQLKQADLKDLATLIMLNEYKTELRVAKRLSKKAEDYAKQGVFNDLLGPSQDTRDWKSGIFLGSLHRHQRLVAWEEELMGASRAYYHKPGYSASANTAISVTTSHEAHMLKLLNELVPKSVAQSQTHQVNIQNNIGGVVAPPQGQEVLTADKAIALLAESGHTALPLNDRATHFLELKAKHNLDDTPNVTANQSDAQGVAKAKSLDKILANMSHEDRRTEEVGQIIEAIE